MLDILLPFGIMVLPNRKEVFIWNTNRGTVTE